MPSSRIGFRTPPRFARREARVSENPSTIVGSLNITFGALVALYGSLEVTFGPLTVSGALETSTDAAGWWRNLGTDSSWAASDTAETAYTAESAIDDTWTKESPP